jgi:NAD+ diphosphatase
MFDGPLPEYPFAGEGHDRLGERRSDAVFLQEAWRDEDRSRALVMRGRELAVEPGGHRLRLLTPREAPAGERMLLGSAGGTVYFLVVVPADAPTVDADLSELRALASLLDPVQSALAVHAVSLAGWHDRHPRCSVCGAVTAIAEAGASRRCPSCSTQHFPRTDPAVIMLITDGADRCLLGHNAARDVGWYSTLAGFVEPGESPEQAVRREVMEETGIGVGRLRYAGAQPWPFPSSLMLGYFGEATTTDISVDGAEITSARWFSREEIAKEVEAGDLVVPSRVSIAGALVTAWFGRELPVRPPP